MDYLVGTSPPKPQTAANMSTEKQPNSGVTKAALTPIAPAAPSSQAGTPPDPSATDMLDLSSFDPLQLDQLTASVGLALNGGGSPSDPGQAAMQQQQQQQYYMAPQQQQAYATAGAFGQPATAALETVGQQTASVVSMDASSTTSTQQYMMATQSMHPAQVLSAAAQQAIPQAAISGFAAAAGQPAPQYSSLASVVSASTQGDYKGDGKEFAEKRPSNWNRMSPEQQRRWERNMREQQRSHKISSQIKELRTVLTESNVPFKPNKYSILLSVAEYIKQLQSRAIMLDAEHGKLIDTIRETSEMVNKGEAPEPDALPSPLGKEDHGSNLSSDADMLFVQGLDYQSVFEQCIAPMGIAALDGRILACNEEFQSVLGYSKEELLKHSLFTVMQNHEEVYKAMGEMLKADEISLDDDGGEEKPPLYWSGVVSETKQQKLLASISLTRSSDGSPKFFNCSLMIT